MLASLAIRDIVLIDRLDLTFHDGLNVLTGETGAGKSILLDALGLALGARGDAGLVRAGTTGDGSPRHASVTAVFEVPVEHPVLAVLKELGIEAPEDGMPLIVRRVLGSDGRGRAHVNDQPVGIQALKRIGETLVEIEGQRGAGGLLDSASHRRALDSFAGNGAAAARTAAAWRAWRSAVDALAEHQALANRSEAEESFLRHATAELAALDPQPGEEQALAERRTLLMNAEKLIEALNAANEALTSGDGVEGGLARAQRALERMAEKAEGRLDGIIGALDRAASEAADALAALETLSADTELDPRRLEEMEERLFALRAAARKHGCTVDQLPTLRGEFEEKLVALDDTGAALAVLARAEEETRAAYLESAEALSAERTTAATRLDKAVMKELPALKLDKARFTSRIERLDEDEWSASGIDRVRFEVATNKGSRAGPIDRIASHGEMSRFLLGLRVVLAETGGASTLVLDEIDSGIGGATAAAVGERLARLGRELQLLVVTHSPQVAACGTSHWHISKGEARGGAVTLARELAPADRTEEIARMLAGARITDEARAAAESLMAGHR